jgi:2-haloacid dehalogenase
LKAAVQSAGLTSLIDLIISVHSMKVFKPSPRVYDRLPSDLNIDKLQIGFVSSNNWDVNGAGSAGFTTVWIQRSGCDTPEELGYPATHRVNAIGDLCRLVSCESNG